MMSFITETSFITYVHIIVAICFFRLCIFRGSKLNRPSREQVSPKEWINKFPHKCYLQEAWDDFFALYVLDLCTFILCHHYGFGFFLTLIFVLPIFPRMILTLHSLTHGDRKHKYSRGFIHFFFPAVDIINVGFYDWTIDHYEHHKMEHMQGQTEDDPSHDIHHEPLTKVILDLLCFGDQWGLRRWILKMKNDPDNVERWVTSCITIIHWSLWLSYGGFAATLHHWAVRNVEVTIAEILFHRLAHSPSFNANKDLWQTGPFWWAMLILAGERCALEFIYHDFHHLSPYPHTIPMMIRMRGNPKEVIDYMEVWLEENKVSGKHVGGKDFSTLSKVLAEIDENVDTSGVKAYVKRGMTSFGKMVGPIL